MIFENVAQLKNYGFKGFKSVEDLWSGSSEIPKVQGVYVVINPTPNKTDFLQKGVGGYFKQKDPNVSTSILQENIVKNADVVYIGQCGGRASKATLKDRISMYLNFGKGKPVGHYGGRFIWQLKNHKDLIFAWKELPNENPSIIEKLLFDEFESYFGKLPFANLKR